MTFEDLKTEILSRARQLEICDVYQAAVIAVDHAGLLSAVSNAGMIEWVYQTGIVDDVLLSEFTEEQLEAVGVYVGETTLENPAGDVFLLKEASITIYLTGNNKCKIRVLGDAGLILNIADNAFADVKICDEAVADIVVSDQGSCCLELTQTSSVETVASQTGVMQIKVTDNAELNHTGNNFSTALIRGYNESQSTYIRNDDAVVNIFRYNNASIIDTTPV